MKGDKSRESRTRDRLLLAKELYLHGLEHSRMEGRLNRMIAVHNFHNAIEIVLRAIMLHHDIRVEKELNLNFETMLKEISDHFKPKEMKLPRRILRVLNERRNHVQHHGIGVAVEEMDLWREDSRDFMKKAYKQYFDEDFESLSRLDWIEDELLKEGLRLAKESCDEAHYAKSLLLSKILFQWASYSLLEFLPRQDVWDGSELKVTSDLLREYRQTIDATASPKWGAAIVGLDLSLRVLADMAKRAEYFAAVLSTGVSLRALKKLEMSTPDVSHLGTYPYWKQPSLNKHEQKEAAPEVYDFVVGTLINWQEQGLDPRVPLGLREEAGRVLKEGDLSWDEFLNPHKRFRKTRTDGNSEQWD